MGILTDIDLLNHVSRVESSKKSSEASGSSTRRTSGVRYVHKQLFFKPFNNFVKLKMLLFGFTGCNRTLFLMQGNIDLPEDLNRSP